MAGSRRELPGLLKVVDTGFYNKQFIHPIPVLVSLRIQVLEDQVGTTKALK
jgi:hypothetical protein